MISRAEWYERVSVSQISVANSLLSTSAFQRGWVSQTISASGNDSRKAATAGKVWTISPREPRRTTRKRWSDMRRLANGLEQRLRGVILGVTHDGHADAKSRGDGALRHGVRSVVSAFGVDIRAQFFQQGFHIRFGEEHDVIHATKCGNELGTRVFIEDGSSRPFEIADAGIGIHADHENVAFAPGTFEITNMPDVQRIKTAVG